jgi:hypothetical protein
VYDTGRSAVAMPELEAAADSAADVDEPPPHEEEDIAMRGEWVSE